MTIQQHASFDSSAAELNATSKLVKAWESKNAKNAAKAGGISMMALSLAACGGSSTTTAVTPVVDTPVVDTPVVDTPVVPVVDAATSQAFTANLDNLTGGSGDDSFNGVYYADGGTGTTAFPGDIVDGGAGTDTLNISVAGTSTAGQSINAINTTGVEKLFVTNYDANANDAHDTTVDTSLMTGLTTVGLTASNATGDTAFSNLTSIVGSELRNGAGDLTVTYLATTVVGVTDSATVEVSNVTAGTYTADGIETLTINSSLVKSTLDAVVSSALTSLVVTGDKDLTITTAVDFVAGTNDDTTIDATINASAFTGKLAITGETNDMSITGGTGNDTINMVATLTSKDVIDGGDGEDTITMNSAALTTQLAGVTNVENLSFNDTGAAAALDASKLSAGVTGVSLSLKDDATGADNLVSTVSKLAGETVTITRADEDADVDGQVDVTLTGATDTAADTATVVLSAIGVNGDEAGDTDGDEYGMGILDVANFETVNISSDKSADGTTITANELMTLTATSATKVDIGGAADLTIGAVGGGAMTSLDASDMTGALTATLAGDKVAVSLGSKSSTINFGSTLDNDDSVAGGAGAADLVTATITGLTATTGALTISNVETIDLTTSGANTIDASGITGTGVTIAVTDNKQTITGLDLATSIELGVGTDVSGTASEIDVTAADATGADDTLTVKISGASTASIVDASGIENLTLTTQAAAHGGTIDLTTFEGDNVNVGSKAGITATATLGLGTLHKNTESVNSTYADALTVSFANSTDAATFVGAGTDIQNVTGSAKGDTVTIGSTGAISHVVSGGAGTDTTNISVTTGFVDAATIDTEAVNITNAAGVDITITGAFHAGVDDITLDGGNSLSTFTTATLNNALKTFDASAFGGNIVATVAADQLDSTVSLNGGALLTDEVSVTTSTAATTYALTSTGVEILRVDSNAAAATTVSVAAATGITTIEVDQGANVATQTFTVSGLSGTETVVLKASDDATAAGNEHILVATLADATGSSDTIGFKVGSGTIDAGARLQTLDIETVSINSDAAADLDLTNLSMTAADAVMSLVVTGDSALTVSGLNADVTSINASGMAVGGSVVQGARSATVASTYTGSDGADTLIHMHSGDVVAAGLGVDTLDVNKSAILGGINVDLSSTTDQLVSYNGSAPAGTVTGFESVDLVGYTGNFGAEVTGSAVANTITGTAQVDVINAGAGDDIINITSTANSADDVVDGGAGTGDTINIVGTTNFTDTDSLIVNVENVTMGTGSINVDLTGQTEAFDITGGTGANVITGGSGDDTIATGTGADTISITATSGTDTFTDFTAGVGGDKFLDTGIEAITAQDVNFLKLAASSTALDVGVTAGVFSANVDVSTAASMSVANVNTLLITTLSRTVSAASDGEKAVLLVSTDVDSALVDTYMYIIEHDGTDFDGVTLLGTLQTTELGAITAANFDGFA